MGFVEGEVELEHVQREVGAQLIGCYPADIFADVRRAKNKRLLHNCDDDEEGGRAKELLRAVCGCARGSRVYIGCPKCGRVYKIADDLRVDERKRDGSKHECAEQEDAPTLL